MKAIFYFCGINEFSNELSVIKTIQLTFTRHMIHNNGNILVVHF